MRNSNEFFFQLRHPINSAGGNDTVFAKTYLGWTPKAKEFLAWVAFPAAGSHQLEALIGCMQDIVVNGAKITEEDLDEVEKRKTANSSASTGLTRIQQVIDAVDITKGCAR